jgi:hypothetical protein
MVSFPYSCGIQSCSLKLVYGIVFLQLFVAVTDFLTAYYYEAGGGWSQPYNYNVITAPLGVSVVANLPTLIDAFSKPRISLCRQINSMNLTAGFSVQMFFMWRIFTFSRLYFGTKIKAILFAICIFIFLVRFLLYSHKF